MAQSVSQFPKTTPVHYINQATQRSFAHFTYIISLTRSSSLLRQQLQFNLFQSHLAPFQFEMVETTHHPSSLHFIHGAPSR